MRGLCAPPSSNRYYWRARRPRTTMDDVIFVQILGTLLYSLTSDLTNQYDYGIINIGIITLLRNLFHVKYL